jgi:hypothetical protein
LAPPQASRERACLRGSFVFRASANAWQRPYLESIREIRAIRGYFSHLLHAKVTQSIIGAAMAVLNERKPGPDEKIYEGTLVIELTSQGHVVESKEI